MLQNSGDIYRKVENYVKPFICNAINMTCSSLIPLAYISESMPVNVLSGDDIAKIARLDYETVS